MLFGYPIAATQNNWLHDCLCETVRNVHSRADAGEGWPAWPNALPHPYRAKLKSRRGLRSRVRAYDRAIRKLSATDRRAVLEALEAENRIPDLLSGACECATIDELPEGVREPVADLFGFAYGLLTDFAVRDQHYAEIFAAVPESLCPFCGTEHFDAPGAPREAMDHYLTRSRYPFAAANLRNLVPMGGKCNSRYKLAVDLLRCADGSRRVAFDPYTHATIGVSLDDSQPFGGETENTPRWEIRFFPESSAVPTWDEVFKVRERYRRDHLDHEFMSWLRQFKSFARIANLKTGTKKALVAALRRYEVYLIGCGMKDRAFLKAAVFRMLRRHCQAGHQRLIAQIRELLSSPSAAATARSTTSSATVAGS